ncbi:MAG: hypothetical protein GX331_05785 [Firmicutes bacterium]|nr:hypothetical protein [Bacillota bacterium]
MKKHVILSMILVLVVSSTALASGWSEPVLWEHSSSETERMPWYDSESKTLYFTRNYNLYESTMVDGSWSEPTEVIIPGVNRRQNQVSPLRRGNNLYFASYSPATDYDFYVSTWNEETQSWGEAVKLETVSSDLQDWGLWVSSDETVMYLISKGPFDGQEVRGGRGVWKSVKVDGEWTIPVPLQGEINSDTNDWCVFVDETTGKFYVSSTREGALGGTYDIWVFDGEDGEAVNLGLPINAGNARSMWTDGNVMFFTGNSYPGGISSYDIFVSFWQD